MRKLGSAWACGWVGAEGLGATWRERSSRSSWLSSCPVTMAFFSREQDRTSADAWGRPGSPADADDSHTIPPIWAMSTAGTSGPCGPQTPPTIAPPPGSSISAGLSLPKTPSAISYQRLRTLSPDASAASMLRHLLPKDISNDGLCSDCCSSSESLPLLAITSGRGESSP